MDIVQDAKAEINTLNNIIQQLHAFQDEEIELLKKEIAELKIKNHNLTVKLSTSLQNNTIISTATEQTEIMQNEIKQERIVFDNIDQQESHATKQINLNSEIEAISNELCMKQQLVDEITENSAHIVDHNAIAENEAKVQTLEKERDELLGLLINFKHDKNWQILALQRRERVQNLERQIEKLQEQSWLIQMKEIDLQMVNVLNEEIVQLKQKLILCEEEN